MDNSNISVFNNEFESNYFSYSFQINLLIIWVYSPTMIMTESDLTLAVPKFGKINDNRKYSHFSSTLLSELILTIFTHLKSRKVNTVLFIHCRINKVSNDNHINNQLLYHLIKELITQIFTIKNFNRISCIQTFIICF